MPPPPRPAQSRSARAPAQGSQRRRAAGDPPTRRTEAALPVQGANRTMRWVMIGGGVAVAGLVALGLAWGPMQRSSQLGALDAATGDAAREQARAFAAAWPDEHVRTAVLTGRGPAEARIVLCREARLLDLLGLLLDDRNLTPAARGEACAALADLWPEDGKGPRLPAELAKWATSDESDPALYGPATRLLGVAQPPGCQEALGRAAGDVRLPAERAVAAAGVLAAIVQQRGEGLARLTDALAGPHRASLLAAKAVEEAVRSQSTPAYADRLFALLAQEDSRPLALAGLSGPRFEVAATDTAARTAFAARLAPFLAASNPDAVLVGALQVAKRQRLYEAHVQLLALLPRLAQELPAGITRDEVADLYGRAVVQVANPGATAGAETIVAGLSAALADAKVRELAAASLGRVQSAEVAALRPALDRLASHKDAACVAALNTLVASVYGRDDIVGAAKSRGWAAVLAEDGKRRARYDAMQAWISAHGDETTVRAGREVLAANRKELFSMRDEVATWLSSKEPTPLGLTRAKFDALSNQINLMIGMVNKAWAGA
jgi:hypothetical protein